jgi:hypothetical protein
MSRILGSTVFLVVFACGTAFALPSTFTDRSLWNVAVGGAPDFSVDLNGFAADTSFATSPLDLGPFSIVQSSGTPAASDNLVDVDPFLFPAETIDLTPYLVIVVEDPADLQEVTIDFDGPLTAFGGDFFDPGNGSSPLLIDLYTTGGIVTLSVLAPDAKTFFGVVNDEPFSKLVFRQGFSDDRLSLDNVVGANAVPEPQTWALFLLGLVALPAVRSRR